MTATLSEHILEELTKRPMTLDRLAAEIGSTYSRVYQAVLDLRTRGAVVIVDHASGLPVWQARCRRVVA